MTKRMFIPGRGVAARADAVSRPGAAANAPAARPGLAADPRNFLRVTPPDPPVGTAALLLVVLTSGPICRHDITVNATPCHYPLTPQRGPSDVLLDSAAIDIRGKKLVFIGGAGLIGSHTVDALTREDVGEIVVYDNFVRGTEENLAGALRDDRV